MNKSTHRSMLWIIALAVTVPLTACNRGPSPEVQAQLDQLQASRDSLTREVAARTETINQLETTIQQATSQMGAEGATAPEELKDRIASLGESLKTTRDQLAQAQRRLGAVRSRSSSLRDSLNAVITDRDGALAMQRDSISALVTSLDSVSGQVQSLTAERSNLQDRLSDLETRFYTVHVAVGTKDELLRRGIIQEEGGAHVLLILWKAGQTLVPSRQLDPNEFQTMDMREATEIPLPESATYQLVSRQNTEYLDPSPDEKGQFSGNELRITDPMKFWQGSRYLIVVEDQ